jgi:hypothetical protein
MEWYWQGKPKYSQRILSQCHLYHHQSERAWPGIEAGLRGNIHAPLHALTENARHSLPLQMFSHFAGDLLTHNAAAYSAVDFVTF